MKHITTDVQLKHLRTIHTLLAQHRWLGVLSAEAGCMWRADLLRAGGAAAVIHFRLVNV